MLFWCLLIGFATGVGIFCIFRELENCDLENSDYDRSDDISDF